MRKSDQRVTTLDLTDEMGRRVATWLRTTYPRDGAKRIARDTGTSPHTVRKWLGGALPENRHMAMMASRWGARFLAFVYAPALSAAEAAAEADELTDLRRRLERLEDALDGSNLDRAPPGAPRLAALPAAPEGERLAPAACGGADAALAGAVDGSTRDQRMRTEGAPR